MDDLKDDNLFVMLKGEPGTRKSTQALSFPKPQYWFSVDKKMRALKIPMNNWRINPADVQFDDYSDYDAIRVKLEKLQVTCPFRTVVFDSVTSIGDAINRQTIKIKTGTTTKAGGEKGMRIGGINVNSIEDYKAENAAFQEVIALSKDIQSFHKVNIVLIAHVVGERKLDEGAVTHQARIIITGGKAISGKIPAYCDEVYHFNVESSLDASKEGNYGCLTVHTGADFARTSLPLPAKIMFGNDPLYDKWIKPAIEQLNKQPLTTIK